MKFIDVNNRNASSGENVITYKKNGGRNQKWIVLKDGNGYRIVSAMNQNLSLDMYTGNVVENQNIDIYQNNDRGVSIPRWRSHPIHENRATESIWTEPCNPLLRATKSTKRATLA